MYRSRSTKTADSFQTNCQAPMTAQTYMLRCRTNATTPSVNEVFQTLQKHEELLKNSKLEVKKLTQQLNLLKNKNIENSIIEQDSSFHKTIDSSEIVIEREMDNVIEIIEENQEDEEKRFIEALREQYCEEESSIQKGMFILINNLTLKIRNFSQASFKAIHFQYVSKNPKVRKCAFLMVSTALQSSLMRLKENGWKILKNFHKLKKEELQQTLKAKGRVLLDIGDFPLLTLHKSIWRWYLQTSTRGNQFLNKTANNLVLYANINKTTAFYRLCSSAKVHGTKVSPGMKKMATVLYFYNKFCFDRVKRDAFGKIKALSLTPCKRVLKIVERARERQTSTLRLWHQLSKQFVEQQKLQRQKKQSIAEKIVIASHFRKLFALRAWAKSKAIKVENHKLKRLILAKMACTKASNMKFCFTEMKHLPEKDPNRVFEIPKVPKIQMPRTMNNRSTSDRTIKKQSRGYATTRR